MRIHGLSTIERSSERRPYVESDEILVVAFGSTPIFTRNYKSAMRLAEYCHVNEPQAGLHWAAACPQNYERAVEIAREHRIHEHLHS